jgi:Cdc6-like AAA superfamily ATPase
MKKLNIKQAGDVLSVWSILEIFSPQSFSKKQELSGGKQELVVDIKEDMVPWENKREVPERQKLFYQIVLGTIDLNVAFNLLIKKYGKKDKSSEPIGVSRKSAIGIIIVDENGCLVKDDQAIALSSFAWAMPKALKEDLKELYNWPHAEKQLQNKFRKFLQEQGGDDKPLPLKANSIVKARDYLKKVLDLPPEVVIDEKFAIISYTSLGKDAYPQPLMLNSFFLEDLLVATTAIKSANPPKSLLRYLGVTAPANRYNILADQSILEEALAPQNMPAAKWPGPGRHPLVLLQQAAVNLSMNKLNENEILGINGPPGTGKTMLLRDVIAGLVSKRAEVLLKFDDPKQAFTFSEDQVSLGTQKLNLYKIDDTLKGFEILIASSNNKVVENITTELPSSRSIAKDITDLRYFKTISDELLQGEATWGLIAAVLGNASNINAFFDKFWKDDDCGLLAYLLSIINETSKTIEIKDLATGLLVKRKPQVITENDPPTNADQAMERWHMARKNFEETLNEVRGKLDELEKIRTTIQALERLESSVPSNVDLKDLIEKNQKRKPHILFRGLDTASAHAWKKESNKLLDWQILRQKVATFPEELKPYFFDKNFFSNNAESAHLLLPWCDAETQLLRDKMFISAIKLHKAFIDAAAKPIRHNLGAFSQLITNSKNCDWGKNKRKYFTDLWSTFFLVVPTVSTTFASVRKMLQDAPPNTFGWLLIDEAGQATPQAAVGAITKSKRVIVTGDPMQIEPVVTLPENLTKAICEKFEVDAKRFNAPIASVQTLADDASSYFAEFGTDFGRRTVGVPLLVHRRCKDPMFSISNNIAYGDLMIQAKDNKRSLIIDCLGKSAWFDVQGENHDNKWCFEEGEKVLGLLTKLKLTAVPPDFYIVTPFKNVANNLRELVEKSKILNGWPGLSKAELPSWTRKHIGTVHTLQGREAEAVILVLGAQNPEENRGARRWAGGTPNLLNVAVTRAKEAIYVVGNRNLWKDCGVFKVLYDKIGVYNVDLEKT